MTVAESSDTDTGGSQAEGAPAPAWMSWAEKARKAVTEAADAARDAAAKYDAVPASEGAARDVSLRTPGDLEQGAEAEPVWASWAKQAAGRVRQQVSEAADQAKKDLAQATEKAKGLELGESAAKASRSSFANLTTGLGRSADAVANASTAMQEKSKAAQQKAKEMQSGAASFAASKAAAAKDKAAGAAGAAKASMAKAGEGLQGMSALAMSPMKLFQFAGVFMLGTMLISLSFSFLPMVVIAPQKFALLFAIGSMTMLSSFGVLKGPKAFAGILISRPKLPFSVAYVVGLVGTLVATLILKNYVLIGVFGLMQVVALLYFLASFVPGGQAALNMGGRLLRKAAAKCGLSALGQVTAKASG